jgi:hypothetical protein
MQPPTVRVTPGDCGRGAAVLCRSPPPQHTRCAPCNMSRHAHPGPTAGARRRPLPVMPCSGVACSHLGLQPAGHRSRRQSYEPQHNARHNKPATAANTLLQLRLAVVPLSTTGTPCLSSTPARGCLLWCDVVACEEVLYILSTGSLGGCRLHACTQATKHAAKHRVVCHHQRPGRTNTRKHSSQGRVQSNTGRTDHSIASPDAECCRYSQGASSTDNRVAHCHTGALEQAQDACITHAVHLLPRYTWP